MANLSELTSVPPESNHLYTKGGYLAKNPTWHEEDTPWKAGEILRMIERNDLKPRSICEVGCGSGGILAELYRRLPDHVSFVGYDISPQAYELAKPKAQDRLQFRLSNLLVEAVEPFDVLLVIDVIEHVEDCFGFLRGLRTKADYKMFHIPLDMSAQKIVLRKALLRRRRDLGHIHYFMKATALAILEDTGYEVIDHFYTASTLDFSAPSAFYALGRWPLKLAAILSKDFAARALGGHSLMVLAR